LSHVSVTYPFLSRGEVLERLKQACVRLEGKLPISRIIPFGSYAVDRYTAGSDIDVVVVYRGNEIENAYKIVMNETRLPRLEPRVYTEEQFAAVSAASPRFAQMLAKVGGGCHNRGRERIMKTKQNET
jgi:predicted nucleotidyltransferase